MRCLAVSQRCLMLPYDHPNACIISLAWHEYTDETCATPTRHMRYCYYGCHCKWLCVDHHCNAHALGSCLQCAKIQDVSSALNLGKRADSSVTLTECRLYAFIQLHQSVCCLKPKEPTRYSQLRAQPHQSISVDDLQELDSCTFKFLCC